MVDKGADLNDLVVLLRRAAPDLPAARIDSMARSLQSDLGGGRVYFKKAPAEGKAFRLGLALAAGVPLTQAVSDLGVHRATGYRLLKRRWPLR